MRSTRQFSGFLLILINIIGQINSQANEVIGCGGFIKSHAEIDFSKVEIKLYVINNLINRFEKKTDKKNGFQVDQAGLA